MSYLDTYLGQLDAALSDPAVMELAINADGSIWLERAGQIHMTPSGLAALPARAVRDLASQIANSTSNTFTETAPLVSAAMLGHWVYRASVEARLKAAETTST